MKVLLDDDVPRPLKVLLMGHDVSTVQDMGWAGIKNVQMLRLAMDARFDVLVTADRNLPFQQNVPALDLAVVVLTVPNKKIETILPIAPDLVAALHPDLKPVLLPTSEVGGFRDGCRRLGKGQR